jgi:acetolactate synthase-1/2/3 large subunit
MGVDALGLTKKAIANQSALDVALDLPVGDLILQYLEQIGVEYVFGIPGGAIEPLYNALARSESRNGIRSIIARHETSAAFMADGYARNSGHLGVCCSTTGPGATNMITGVASAFENNIPLLVITPQTSQNKFGRKAMQESGDTGVNVVGMYQFCTLYNSFVSHVEQLENKLISAIMTALRPPYGPVHLSIPADIFKATLPQKGPSYDLKKALKRPLMQDQEAVAELCDQLAGEHKVVFVLGIGSREAAGLIIDIAGLLGAAIVATPDGKSLISPYHPLFKGVIGFAGHKSADAALTDPLVDSVVVVGTTLGEFTSNAWDKSTLLNNRLIHVEDDEANLIRSPMAKLHVRGNISSIFSKVLDELILKGFTYKSDPQTGVNINAEFERAKKDDSKFDGIMHFSLEEPIKIYDASVPIKPQWLMHRLTKIFPSNTKYLADTGNNLAWAIHYLNPFDRRVCGQRRGMERWKEDGRRHSNGGLFQVCAEFCSMGWSVGSAVGASLANPDEHIVCIIGDGSFLMLGNEITVALQNNLSITFLIMNDSTLGMVKHGQILNKSASIGHQLPHVNFAQLADSMGIPGYRISTPDDLKELNIEVITRRKGPTVLDVLIDGDEVPPMATRLKGMK